MGETLSDRGSGVVTDRPARRTVYLVCHTILTDETELEKRADVVWAGGEK